jgi:hypothetical protein
MARGDVADRPGQAILRLPVGSCVLMHGNLWHRALPTQPGGTIRRLLLWTYNPCWMKPTNLGVKPTGGLVAQLLAQPDVDQETKELLGVAGFI